MLTFLRALTYATLFVAFFLVVIPQRILRGSGYKWSGSPSWSELTGMGLVIVGFALVTWCLVTFAFVGKGTAAPFDPPRRLVVAGPYRFVRNPIYIGAVVAMLGAAMVLWSSWLVLYAFVDRKSTRLNSSHLVISYAVFCLKKKKDKIILRLLLSQLIEYRDTHPRHTTAVNFFVHVVQCLLVRVHGELRVTRDFLTRRFAGC